jgi:hypothetical protein
MHLASNCEIRHFEVAKFDQDDEQAKKFIEWWKGISVQIALSQTAMEKEFRKLLGAD